MPNDFMQGLASVMEQSRLSPEKLLDIYYPDAPIDELVDLMRREGLL